MSETPTKPAGKGRAAKPTNTVSPSASNTAATNDDVIPILIAANPGLTLNYKQMTALDLQHRTYSSWEHKFRKWRAKAKEIMEGTATSNGESSKEAGDVGGNMNAEPDAAVKLKTASPPEIQGSNHGDDAPITKSKVTKKAPAKAKVEKDVVANKQAAPEAAPEDDNASDKKVVPIRQVTAKKRPAKALTRGEDSSAKNGENLDNDGEDATAKANTSKKRDETTQDPVNGSPPKKARAEKKGTARIVKKKAKKPTETDEEISEDEAKGSEKIVKPKPKAKAKGGKAAGVAKPATNGSEKAVENEGETVEMQFDAE